MNPLALMLSLFIPDNFPCSECRSGGHAATPAYFWLVLTGYVLLPLFTFNLYISLYLEWVSYNPHIVGPWFLIHSDNLCLLTGVFSLLFK